MKINWHWNNTGLWYINLLKKISKKIKKVVFLMPSKKQSLLIPTNNNPAKQSTRIDSGPKVWFEAHRKIKKIQFLKVAKSKATRWASRKNIKAFWEKEKNSWSRQSMSKRKKFSKKTGYSLSEKKVITLWSIIPQTKRRNQFRFMRPKEIHKCWQNTCMNIERYDRLFLIMILYQICSKKCTSVSSSIVF